MKKFTYTITDPVGIHARPASMLVQKVKELDGVTVTITKGEKSVNVLRLMALMSMGIKQGDTVTVSVEGGQEESAVQTLEEYFKNNL